MHVKTCTAVENERRGCKWCSQSFPSFASVRQHKRRKHSAEYNSDLEQKLPASDDKIFRRIAEIEASCAKGTPFLKRMAKAVNLTERKVRHRREKLKYARFLEEAREKRKNQTKALIPQNTAAMCTFAMAPTEISTGPEQPIGPKIYAELVRISPREAEPAPDRTTSRTPQQSPLVSPPIGKVASSPGFHDSQRPGPSTKRQATPPSPPSSKRLTPHHRVMTPATTESNVSRKRRRRSRSDNRMKKKPLWQPDPADDFASAEEGLAIKGMLMTLREKAAGCDVLRRLVDAAMTDTIELVQGAMDQWAPSASRRTARRTQRPWTLQHQGQSIQESAGSV